MHLKKICSLALMALCFYSFAFAGELLTKEAMMYFQEGVKAQNGGDLSNAEVFYQKALLVDSANQQLRKSVLNNRGAILAKVGDFANAEEALNAALAIDPDYQQAKINLALICDKRCSRLEALERWVKAYNIEKLKPRDYVVDDQQQSLNN